MSAEGVGTSKRRRVFTNSLCGIFGRPAVAFGWRMYPRWSRWLEHNQCRSLFRLLAHLRRADLFPSGKANLPVGDGAIWSEECLGPVRYWFCDFGDLLELLEIKLDTES